MVSPTAPALTAPDLQAQANQTSQRHDRPTVAVADPHRLAAFRAGTPERNQDLLVRRLHTAPTSGHLQPPCSTPPDILNRQLVLPFLKKSLIERAPAPRARSRDWRSGAPTSLPDGSAARRPPGADG